MRYLAWLGGILFGLGLLLEASAVLTGPGRTPMPRSVAGTALVLFLVMLAVRRVARPAAIKSAARVAAWTVLIPMMLFAPATGTWDTKEKSYKTQMVGQLHEIRDVEARSLLDSGRYTTAPVLVGWMADSTPGIVLTRDGWTASVEHLQLPGVRCVMFEGSVALAPATRAAEPRCTPTPFPIIALLPGLGLMLGGAAVAFVCVRFWDGHSQSRNETA